MTPSFNLIEQPWLPCVRLDGQPVRLGLYETLAQAHTLRELQGEIPLSTAALHRLLLAILHRNFGPANRSAWARLWQAGRWDAGALRAYFDRWRDRFDLFHETHPFYQSAEPARDPETLTRLSLTHAYNSTLFEHQADGEAFAVDAARAAEWLVTMQASGIGMGPPFNPYPAGPLVNTLLVLVQGRNLFETLAFNLIEYDPKRNKPIPGPRQGEDRPIWEYDENPYPPQPKKFYRPGYLGYLTFQVRTIHLYPAREGGELCVRECVLGQGARWDNQAIADPMKVYFTPKKKDVGALPLRLREDRATWRDSGALFRLQVRESDEAKYRPPLAFDLLAECVEDGYVDRAQTYNYVTLGLCNSNARLDFFRHERMPLPLAYFDKSSEHEPLEEQLRLALQRAEDTAKALRNAGRDLARWIVSPADKKKAHRDGVKAVYARLDVEHRYWPRLEVSFQHFLRDLPAGPPAAMDTWTATLQNTARRAFEEAAASADDPLRGLKAATLARGTLEVGLAKALKTKT
jgi:CRISPR system Cascade subunit CasA